MPLLNVLLFGTLAGLATLLGVFLVVKNKSWVDKNLIYLISFSAGVLLSLAFTDLLPEALTLNNQALLVTLIAFLAFYLLEHALSLHTCEEKEECEVHQTFTLVTGAGLLLHSLIDGLIIGLGFEVSFSLGVLSALAVLLHRLPDGISSMAVMLYGGRSLREAVIFSLAVALITPLGAIFSLFIFTGIVPQTAGLFLAVAAGSFLYVAASELIPEIHKKSRYANILLTFLGALLPLGVSLFF